jgi:hypothetical protein
LSWSLILLRVLALLAASTRWMKFCLAFLHSTLLPPPTRREPGKKAIMSEPIYFSTRDFLRRHVTSLSTTFARLTIWINLPLSVFFFWLDTLALPPCCIAPLKQYINQFFVLYLIASLLLLLAAEAWEFRWNPYAPGYFYTGWLSEEQLQNHFYYNRQYLKWLLDSHLRSIDHGVATCINFELKYGPWALVVSTFAALIIKVIGMVC